MLLFRSLVLSVLVPRLRILSYRFVVSIINILNVIIIIIIIIIIITTIINIIIIIIRLILCFVYYIYLYNVTFTLNVLTRFREFNRN